MWLFSRCSDQTGCGKGARGETRRFSLVGSTDKKKSWKERWDGTDGKMKNSTGTQTSTSKDFRRRRGRKGEVQYDRRGETEDKSADKVEKPEKRSKTDRRVQRRKSPAEFILQFQRFFIRSRTSTWNWSELDQNYLSSQDLHRCGQMWSTYACWIYEEDGRSGSSEVLGIKTSTFFESWLVFVWFLGNFGLSVSFSWRGEKYGYNGIMSLNADQVICTNLDLFFTSLTPCWPSLLTCSYKPCSYSPQWPYDSVILIDKSSMLSWNVNRTNNFI